MWRFKSKSKPRANKPTVKNLVAIDGTLDALTGLRVRVLEKGRRARPEELHIRRKDSMREHIPCSNPLCQGGGVSLGDVLREMVGTHQSEFIGTSFCIGQEGDLEKPDTLVSCQTRFEIEAQLHYR